MKKLIPILLFIFIVVIAYSKLTSLTSKKEEDLTVPAEEKTEIADESKFFQVGIIIDCDNEIIKNNINSYFCKELEKITDVDVESKSNKDMRIGRSFFVVRFVINETAPTNKHLAFVIFTKVGDITDLDFCPLDDKDIEELDSELAEKDFYIDYITEYFDVNSIDLFVKEIADILNEAILEPEREKYKQGAERAKKSLMRYQRKK